MYKIMIADDEGITVDALKYIIKKNFRDECIVESAKTGREVILLAESFRPDIAFMDIHMKKMTGLELAREIKANFPKVVLIFCTAYSDYAFDAVSMYAKGYLLKPISSEDIITTLDEMVYDWRKEEDTVLNEIRVQTF